MQCGDVMTPMQNMPPITEQMKVRYVKVRALQPTFYTGGGKLAVVGEEISMSLGDAEDLVRRGKAAIVEGSERLVSIGFAPDARLEKKWPATRW